MADKPNLDNVKMHLPEGDMVPTEEPKQVGIIHGPILGLLVVLLLLILGGMYWWYVTILQVDLVTPTATRPTPEQNNEPESTTAEAQTQVMGTMSTSDELSAIEADLEGTNLDSLDAELTAIEAELDAAR